MSCKGQDCASVAGVLYTIVLATSTLTSLRGQQNVGLNSASTHGWSWAQRLFRHHRTNRGTAPLLSPCCCAAMTSKMCAYSERCWPAFLHCSHHSSTVEWASQPHSGQMQAQTVQMQLQVHRPLLAPLVFAQCSADAPCMFKASPTKPQQSQSKLCARNLTAAAALHLYICR